tara:strand:- start:881 stop:1735 length:855 start_codon:yes stop_codon:yes gene_type:complete
MENNLFNTEFARNSKFDANFVGNISKKNEWKLLADQFKYFLDNKKSNKPLVPKLIHQIWLGDKKLPKNSIPWMKSWKKYNPDWEYKLWNEKNIKELNIKNFDVYSKKINPGYRSDILRYIILKKFGGLYADTDFECLKPIPSDILKYKFIAGTMFGDNPYIGNSILLSKPNFILLDNILTHIKSTKYKNDINHIIKNSGPENVTKEYFSLKKKIKDQILILPSNYFYPYPNFRINDQINKYLEIEEISIGIHHWEMTWMKGSLLNRIKNKFKLFLKFNKNKNKK